MLVAKWKSGFESIHHADAQKVAKEIMSIGDSATPEQIVEKAKKKNTELHKCFTWDDGEAANKWRLHEARQIVCHLMVKNEDRKEKQPELRFFMKAESNNGYQPTQVIFRNEDSYNQLIQKALGELTAFRRKYTFLSDRKEMIELINALELMAAENAS